MTKIENIVRIVLLALVTIALFAAGAMKLAGLPFEVNGFLGWGYPLWFMYLIGVCEIAGAIGLHIPKLARYAGLGLTIILLGAIGTHVSHNEGLVAPIPATVLMLMLFYIMYVSHKKPAITA